MSEEKVMCHKLTLSTAKIVMLRDPKIKDQELAAQIAGGLGGDNNLATAIIWQKEMLKLLLLQVGDKKLSNNEKENLDALFTLREYTEISMAMKQLVGDPTVGKFQMEFVPAGSP